MPQWTHSLYRGSRTHRMNGDQRQISSDHVRIHGKAPGVENLEAGGHMAESDHSYNQQEEVDSHDDMDPHSHESG